MRGTLGLVVVAILLGACSRAGGGNGTIGGQPSIPIVSNVGQAILQTPPPRYTVTDLGPNVNPAHINGVGAIVGSISTNPNGTGAIAFVWRSGKLTRLRPLSGYASSQANWINKNGEIIGTSFNFVANEARATRFVPGSTPINLGVAAGYNESVADSVNDNGLVVGAVSRPKGSLPPAYGVIATFKGPNSARIINASYGGESHAINIVGKIVGANCCPSGFPDTNTAAFVYPPLTLLTMPSDSGDGASAQDVNAKGDVVGFYSGGPFNRSNTTCCGFYLHAGMLTEIDDPTRGSSQGFLEALALNDSDLIVGEFGSKTIHAFLYINRVIDLNTLIPATCKCVLHEATSINNLGQIVGNGTLGGVEHGFLLTPQ